MNTFSQLFEGWEWREIRNCPGRYVLRGGVVRQPAQQLFGLDVIFRRFELDGARDQVIVAKIEGGGLISYRQKEGTYVHTLADEAGFERKLQELGIDDVF